MLAAELVAPLGGVVISDQAESMLEGARARAVALGLSNVEFQVLNARMDRPPARERRRRAVPLGLHADGRSRRRAGGDATGAAPRRAPRAGRVGGHLAQPVGRAARARAGGAAPAAPPGGQDRAPGPFALGSVEELSRLLHDAGFVEVEVQELELVAPPRPLRRAVGVDARPLPRIPRRRARQAGRGDRRDRALAGGPLCSLHGGRRHARDPRRARSSPPQAPDPRA